MSLARKHALISAAVWLVIGVAYTVILADTGVERVCGEAGHGVRSLLAAVILPGYLISFAVMAWARRGRRAGDIDERDEAVERKAGEITTIVVLLAVFLASIRLYDAHAAAGTVPAGWLWIMAYGTVILVSVTYPVVRLILDYSGRVDA